MAEPGKIAQTAQAFRVPIDGIIVVVDAEQVREQARNRYIGETVCRQLQQADMVVLNKADPVPEFELNRLRDWLGEHALLAPVHVASRGVVPGSVLLGGVPHRVGYFGLPSGAGHSAAYRSWILSRDRPVARQALSRLADRLGRRVFRAKGFVRLAEAPDEVQLFQQVGRRWTLRKVKPPQADLPGMQVVVIEQANDR